MLVAEYRLTGNEMHLFERIWIAAVSNPGVKRGAPCPLESEPKRRRLGTHSGGSSTTCVEEMELDESCQQQNDTANDDAMDMDPSFLFSDNENEGAMDIDLSLSFMDIEKEDASGMDISP
jgi:hypothetical protein